jgi:hypothetical protein
MAEIERKKFAAALTDRLRELGYSYGKAVEMWPALNRAMLSRACNGMELSAANYLLVCEMAGLDPYRFLAREKQVRHTLKSILNQPVTAGVSREAREAGR